MDGLLSAYMLVWICTHISFIFSFFSQKHLVLWSLKWAACKWDWIKKCNPYIFPQIGPPPPPTVNINNGHPIWQRMVQVSIVTETQYTNKMFESKNRFYWLLISWPQMLLIVLMLRNGNEIGSGHESKTETN